MAGRPPLARPASFLALHLTAPRGPNPAMCPEPTTRRGALPYPRQIAEELDDVLDVDVTLLASIEHQMLEVLHWS